MKRRNLHTIVHSGALHDATDWFLAQIESVFTTEREAWPPVEAFPVVDKNATRRAGGALVVEFQDLGRKRCKET